jgi:amino acid transporter
VERPARRLRLWDCIAIGVNGIVGGGIFVLPAPMAAAAGPASPLAFLLCGAFVVAVGFSFAELASAREESGGPYLYVREAFGEAAGFAVTWMAAAAGLFGLAAVARTFAAYLGAVVPAAAGAEGAVAVALIVALGAANALGVRHGARASNALAAAKIAALLLFVGAGALAVRAENLAGPVPEGLSGLAKATLLAVFALSGFEVVPAPAGETVEPRRAMPIALVASVAGAAILYVAVQAVAVGVSPQIASSQAPLAHAAEVALGAPGRALLAAAAMISTAGFCAGVALATPRYITSLAADGLLPRALSRFSARTGTPVAAVFAVAAVGVALTLAGRAAELVDLSVAAIVIQYLPVCLAVPVLRRRGAAGAFRLPLGPLIPLLGATGTVTLLALADAKQLLIAGGVLALGLVVYAIGRLRRG